MIPVTHALIIIILTSLCTLLTRAVPFLIWGGKRPMPDAVKQVADKLPTAIMAILVIYCLKDISPAAGGTCIATIIAVIAVVLLHLKKRNLLLSIAAGTVIYMLLIRCL